MSTLVPPPAKRQRTDESDDASVTRSDIWYSDGSVVLQAQNTQFRVHWSLLGQHSTFFRDMQTLPQPPDQPVVEGCSVVELQDSVEDVKHLLTVLYNPNFAYQKAVPFEIVAALIRLGRKYEFRSLLDSAVERVTSENPTTLEEYDILEGSEDYYPKSILDYPGLEFDMLALARENNIMTALPCAYYRILKYYTHRHLFDGFTKADGTLFTLSPVDQKLCSLGREKIIAAQMLPGSTSTLGWLCKWDYATDCTSSTRKCKKLRGTFLQECFTDVSVRALTKAPSLAFCAGCTRRVEELVSAGRNKAWEELPAFFDLPPWAKLKNDI
ncbi:hypothetical protein C8F04DRAFT_1389847 [Mycena alexandri]|uniref:BTB domain-containing protein n=1 Tax=Mycena alexandri TaxID=1745969 RepID=A0AAD6XCW5_9AGAR|nr:hypothetical protein C8F04DRAFT_1389847 [Mycena alexandri]